MQFALIDGVLRVTAEGKAEVMEVFKHYRMNDSPDGIESLVVSQNCVAEVPVNE